MSVSGSRDSLPEWRGLAQWEALAQRLDRLFALDQPPEVLRQLAQRADNSEADDALGAVAICEALGLRARPMRGSARDLANAVGADHPVAYRGTDGTWELVTVRRGKQLWIEPLEGKAAWVSADNLGAPVDADGSLLFVAVDPPTFGKVSGSHDDGPPTPWQRLRALLRHERHDVLVALIYAVGIGLLTLATPIAVQALVNSVAFGTLLQPLAVLTGLLFIGLVFAGVLRALQAWVVEVLQRRLFLRLVDDLSHRLPRIELAAFDRAHGPELVNRFFDLFTIQKAASSLLIDGMQIVLTAVVGMLVLAFYHPLLLAFDVLLLVVVAVILFGLGRGATRTAVKESKAKYEVAGWLEEVARHPTAFKLGGGPNLARGRADELAGRYLGYRHDHFRVVFRQLVGALSLQAFASAGILGIGGWLVVERQLTLGQLVAAELIVTMVVASFAKVGKHLETTYDLLAALDKVGQLVDLPMEAIGVPITAEVRDPRGASVEAKGVSFGHDWRAPLISNMDISISPGERVCIKGGGTPAQRAFIDLLLGLRTPWGGRVWVDGVDVAELDRAELRKRTVLVRGAELVLGSILDNVAFGRRDVDAKAARAALRAVGVLEELERLPERLETRIMPDGSPLSRGQAARVAIARAIAARPSLLVVDGALEGLDAQTLERTLDALCDERAPWTLVLASDDPIEAARCARSLSVTTPADAGAQQ